MNDRGTFRAELLSGSPMVGTWMKTPSPTVAEVLALTDLDCVCLDAEHAPFDRGDLDQCLSVLTTNSKPALVRIPAAAPEHILNALDLGADGVVAPHICNGQQAKDLAQSARFGAGGRGYAGSTRFAGFTRASMSETLRRSKEETAVIAQIEDLEALDHLDAIASVEGVDCLFIGRIDLTVAMGADSPSAPEVLDAVKAVCAAGEKHGRRVGMFLSDLSEIPDWVARGASLFLLQSDQAFLLDGAKRLKASFQSATA